MDNQNTHYVKYSMNSNKDLQYISYNEAITNTEIIRLLATPIGYKQNAFLDLIEAAFSHKILLHELPNKDILRPVKSIRIYANC